MQRSSVRIWTLGEDRPPSIPTSIPRTVSPPPWFADQLRGQRERFNAEVTDRAGIEQFVREYLSVQHRDNSQDGCPSAAVLDEIARCADATKRAYTDGGLAIVDDIVACLAPRRPTRGRAKTLSALAMMIGILQLSRAVADRQLAEEVFDQASGALSPWWAAEHPPVHEISTT